MAGSPKPPFRRRRLLERPRLIRALDRSRARVRMLVAGPGFGKTILAEQWAAGERRVAWVRAHKPSADVAVLAREMAAAGAEIIPGSDRRLRERLNATADPTAELDVLIDLLSEDFADWPEDAWIVIDDYQHIRESATAEAFVEGLVLQSPVQVMISTRDRPTWVSTRSILYGEVLEIGQTMLAMTEDEVTEMLAGVRDEMTSGLLALAGGWPAVIGLASLTTSDSPLPEEHFDLPEQLYEFFADEVYRGLEPDVRNGLGLLATAPSLDRELAVELLGPERAERVCGEALTLGVLEERGGKLELHPLAAAFLEERARREGISDIDDAIEGCIVVYRKRLEWDAAFELVCRYGTEEDLNELFSGALDSLLNGARLTTIQTWIDRADARRLVSPTVGVARAELALRGGLHMSAQAFAESAMDSASDEQLSEVYRAAMVAGRAAHSGSREVCALGFYRVAEEAATSQAEVRDALWGQLMCASALELDEAPSLLSRLESTIGQSDPYELIRMVDKKLGMDFRFGAVRHLADARRVSELVGHVADPFVRCSFRCAYACALNLSANYEDGHAEAVLLLDDATEFRVEPVRPYAYLMLAAGFAGLSDYTRAHEALDSAVSESRRCHDEFGLQSAYSSRVRVLIQEGRALDACTIEPPDLRNSLNAMRGEVMASRGLALATVGRLQEGRRLGEEAVATTGGVEARVLATAIEAVCAVLGRTPRMLDAVEAMIGTAFEAGAVDLVVTAYRGNPDLLVAMLSSASTRDRTLHIVARARDEGLSSALGSNSVSAIVPVKKLSPREREVYDLLCEGLSNSEIAKRLFISEATVKVHVHHVFDKFGVRSRTALAMNAARDRWLQAAFSVTADGSAGTSLNPLSVKTPASSE